MTRLHTTRPRQALGLCFSVGTDDAALCPLLEAAFGDLATADGPALQVRLAHEGDELTVTAEDRSYYRGDDRGQALAMLARAVNREVVLASDHLLLIHAAAVERDGSAVMLPGPPGAGKSTLVAGLLRRGFRGLTDEVVAVDPDSGVIQPYPRPISLKRGSWTVLEALRPRVAPETEAYFSAEWLLAPSGIGNDGVGRPARAVLLVIPRYEAGAPTTVRPLSRADALDAVATCSHNLAEWGGPGFLALADLVRVIACHRLTSAALNEACDAVEGLFEEATGAR